MKKVEELIQKVKDGKVAILNDGTIEQLREVLGCLFPNNVGKAESNSMFYEASKVKGLWFSDNFTCLPTVSVKEFYEDEVRVKNILFITEDGKAIYEMDCFWLFWETNAPAGIKLLKVYHETAEPLFNGEVWAKECKKYSTKEAAEKGLTKIKLSLPSPIKTKNEDEFVWGEEVEVSESGTIWHKRFYVAKNPKSHKDITTTQEGFIREWELIRKLPTKLKLTHQMIADKFGVVLGTFEIIN